MNKSKRIGKMQEMKELIRINLINLPIAIGTLHQPIN